MTGQDWVEVAEAFECPPRQRNSRQKGLAEQGLCLAAYLICERPLLDQERQILEQYRPDTARDTAFFWPCRLYWGDSGEFERRYDFLRAEVARKMASLSSDTPKA